MGYEIDPHLLPYPLNLLEKYGKDYKPKLTVRWGSVVFSDVYLIDATTTWITFADGEHVYEFPAAGIMVRVAK